MPPTDGTESGSGSRVGVEVRVRTTVPPSPLLFTGILGFLEAANKCQSSGPRSGVRVGVRTSPSLCDAHAEAWSSGTPPTKRSVSRLRPSVPLGLWPRTGGSPSTESVPRRQCLDSSRRCHRPGSTSTVLVSTAGPEPVSNLGGWGHGSRCSGQPKRARTTARSCGSSHPIPSHPLCPPVTPGPALPGQAQPHPPL